MMQPHFFSHAQEAWKNPALKASLAMTGLAIISGLHTSFSSKVHIKKVVKNGK